MRRLSGKPITHVELISRTRAFWVQRNAEAAIDWVLDYYRHTANVAEEVLVKIRTALTA